MYCMRSGWNKPRDPCPPPLKKAPRASWPTLHANVYSSVLCGLYMCTMFIHLFIYVYSRMKRVPHYVSASQNCTAGIIILVQNGTKPPEKWHRRWNGNLASQFELRTHWHLNRDYVAGIKPSQFVIADFEAYTVCPRPASYLDAWSLPCPPPLPPSLAY